MNQTSNLELDGLVAVVTGAAQGLGLEIASELARNITRVVIADIQLPKAEEEAKDLRDQGLKVTASSLDVTNSEAVEKNFQELVGEHSRLDILVNSAGLGQNVAPVVELSDAEWRRVIDVNLTGTFNCCRAAAKIMEVQESGSIVNLASINGHNPAALVAAYNAAKAGVISLTRTLSLELAAYGVRVNAVSPGPVYTDFNKKLMAQRAESLNLTEEEMVERIRSAVPLGRWGQEIDIANAVAFLSSPRTASWITGEILQVHGGLTGVAAAPPRRK